MMIEEVGVAEGVVRRVWARWLVVLVWNVCSSLGEGEGKDKEELRGL